LRWIHSTWISVASISWVELRWTIAWLIIRLIHTNCIYWLVRFRFYLLFLLLWWRIVAIIILILKSIHFYLIKLECSNRLLLRWYMRWLPLHVIFITLYLSRLHSTKWSLNFNRSILLKLFEICIIYIRHTSSFCFNSVLVLLVIIFRSST